ncbi:MAG: ATP-binding protein [Pseudomonadota bacterium]
MEPGFFKRPLPRSLYARAALILIVPIVTIQLVVSLVFIQDHFEDVTEQMTQNIVLEIRQLVSRMDAAGDRNRTLVEMNRYAQPLALFADLGRTEPAEDSRLWYDLSGRVVIKTLREGLDGVLGIDLATDDKLVNMLIETSKGNLFLTFERRRVSASNPHQLIVLIITLGLIMAAISYIFLRNQLRPIKRLASAAEAFGKGQSVPYRPTGAIEVRAAGNAFLDMRGRIERAIEQRTMMLSGVSHDLRTPLTRLRLGLSMLDEEETTDLKRDVDDMERLLDTFLNFARGSALEELAETDPVALARGVVENAQRLDRDVTLLPATEGTLVRLRPIAIERALENLVKNAIRYGTKCQVSVVLFDRSVRFRVEDNGPGIAPEDRETALKPFARLDPARNQDRGTGVGLGLAIAVDIARNHGGTLRLGESADLGGLQADLILAR